MIACNLIDSVVDAIFKLSVLNSLKRWAQNAGK
jgi:hypothetical protein